MESRYVLYCIVQESKGSGLRSELVQYHYIVIIIIFVLVSVRFPKIIQYPSHKHYYPIVTIPNIRHLHHMLHPFSEPNSHAHLYFRPAHLIPNQYLQHSPAPLQSRSHYRHR